MRGFHTQVQNYRFSGAKWRVNRFVAPDVEQNVARCFRGILRENIIFTHVGLLTLGHLMMTSMCWRGPKNLDRWKRVDFRFLALGQIFQLDFKNSN